MEHTTDQRRGDLKPRRAFGHWPGRIRSDVRVIVVGLGFFVQSGCTSFASPCTAMDANTTWQRGTAALREQVPVDVSQCPQGSRSRWYRSSDGRIGRCCVCARSSYRAASFETWRAGAVETVMIRSCGPY